MCSAQNISPVFRVSNTNSYPMSGKPSKVIHSDQFLFLVTYLRCSQGKAAAHKAAIAVRRPTPGSARGFTRSNQKVRSDCVWMDRDDERSIIRFQRYLEYAPTVVLPLTLRSLRKPLTSKSRKSLEANTEKLLAPSHPARCTSAKYVDRNGEPLLYYFGRRLVRPDDRKVGLFICRHCFF